MDKMSLICLIGGLVLALGILAFFNNQIENHMLDKKIELCKVQPAACQLHINY